MAQAITNTVPKTSYAGLFTPPKNTYGGLFATPSFSTSAPAQSFTAKPLFPSAQTSGSVVAPLAKPAAAAPIAQAPVGNAAAAPVSTAPIASPTVNPNIATPTPATQASVRGLFPNVLTSLTGIADKNTALATNAGQIAADYGKSIADVGGQGARFEAGQRTTGTTPVAEGNAAVTAQSTAAEQAALAQGESAALQGVTTGVAANAAGANALGTVAGYAQPQVTAFGQTSFNPATGEFAGGANGGLPPDVMQQYAQMASNGQYAAIPSFITSNPVLNAQLNTAAKAFNPNYNPVQAAGASSVLQGIPALQSAATAADGIKNTIQTYLAANPTINASNSALVNQAQQWINGKQLTDPKYQILFNYLDEYTNKLAPILGVGGNPTNLKTQIAQGFVNAAASGDSISKVLDSTAVLAKNAITDLQSGATGGGTSVPNTTAGSSLYSW